MSSPCRAVPFIKTKMCHLLRVKRKLCRAASASIRSKAAGRTDLPRGLEISSWDGRAAQPKRKLQVTRSIPGSEASVCSQLHAPGGNMARSPCTLWGEICDPPCSQEVGHLDVQPKCLSLRILDQKGETHWPGPVPKGLHVGTRCRSDANSISCVHQLLCQQ